MGERRTIWLVRCWLIDEFWKQCCALISHLILTFWDMNLWRDCGAMASLHNVAVWMRDLCSGVGIKNSFHDWDWYSLIWFMWLCMLVLMQCTYLSPSVLWASLTSIMNYPLCMTHNLATVNRYDHAWTDNWAQNICKLSMLVFPMQLKSDGRQHDTRGRLYATKVKWKNYLTCFPLLGMGLMIVLRRASW